MNTGKIVSIIGLVIITTGSAFWYFYPQQKGISVDQNSSTASSTSGRVMSIESYVTQHISSLSPIKEQVGGTFFVTKIEAANGKGVVEYEDGHNAYTADFTYNIDPEKGISIKSFTTR